MSTDQTFYIGPEHQLPARAESLIEKRAEALQAMMQSIAQPIRALMDAFEQVVRAAWKAVEQHLIRPFMRICRAVFRRLRTAFQQLNIKRSKPRRRTISTKRARIYQKHAQGSGET